MTVAPLAVAPVHDHADGWYPIGPPDSAIVQVPALTSASVTVAEPDVPEIGVGPEAESVQSVAVAVAPVVPLSTSLTRVS